MPVSTPSLPKEIEEKVNTFVHILRKQVQEDHIDGVVNIGGYGRNGLGAQIIIENIEELTSDEIEFWKSLAQKDASISYIADLGSGKIVFDIEYKRSQCFGKCSEWLIYPIVLSVLTMLLQVA